MGATVIANRAEGLIGAEQAIGAAERLDDALVVDDLVEVERVEPFGVEAREHLVHYDEQVDARVAVGVDVDVGLLVRQARRDVLFHGGPCRDGELLAVCFVVVFNELDQGIFLHRRAGVVVNARVEKGGHLHLRRLHLKGVVVVDRLGDGARRQDRVEPAAVGEHREAAQDVLYDLSVVRGAGPVLGAGEEILDALDAVSGAVDHRSHGDLCRVHIVVEDLALSIVGDGFGYCCGFRLL